MREATTVMVVSGGYPEEYEKEKDFWTRKNYGFYCFHAGTKTTERTTVTRKSFSHNLLW
jgi:phosphoribosylamine-glycine ligase